MTARSVWKNTGVILTAALAMALLTYLVPNSARAMYSGYSYPYAYGYQTQYPQSSYYPYSYASSSYPYTYPYASSYPYTYPYTSSYPYTYSYTSSSPASYSYSQTQTYTYPLSSPYYPYSSTYPYSSSWYPNMYSYPYYSDQYASYPYQYSSDWYDRNYRDAYRDPYYRDGYRDPYYRGTSSSYRYRSYDPYPYYGYDDSERNRYIYVLPDGSRYYDENDFYVYPSQRYRYSDSYFYPYSRSSYSSAERYPYNYSSSYGVCPDRSRTNPPAGCAERCTRDSRGCERCSVVCETERYGSSYSGSRYASTNYYAGGSCACTSEYDPVCGQDGRTYSNPCKARCEGIPVSYYGQCRSSF